MKHFNLDKSFKPDILKTLSNEELNLLSMEIRSLIIERCSEFGGHLSSNLGNVELTIAIHKHFNLPEDKLLFDVGHQCYTHKILTGRPLENLRQENGISGFQKRSESIYDAYEAGHSSTSISIAEGMALTRDLNKDKYEVIAVIGDGTISNGLAFEALNHLGALDTKVIIILNDNNMCIGETVGGLHKSLKEGNIFKHLGYEYIDNVNGHDFDSLSIALQKAKEAAKSVVVHVSTIKGKGYIHSENYKIVNESTGVDNTVDPVDTIKPQISFIDDNRAYTGGMEKYYTSDGKRYVRIYSSNKPQSAWANLDIGFDSAGNIFTAAPTPPANSDNTSIATTEWVHDTIQAYPDNASIKLNSSNKMRAEGYIDANDNTTVLKSWTGTKAEYDALVTDGEVDSDTF